MTPAGEDWSSGAGGAMFRGAPRKETKQSVQGCQEESHLCGLLCALLDPGLSFLKVTQLGNDGASIQIYV